MQGLSQNPDPIRMRANRVTKKKRVATNNRVRKHRQKMKDQAVAAPVPATDVLHLEDDGNCGDDDDDTLLNEEDLIQRFNSILKPSNDGLRTILSRPTWL